jgi:predicted ATPase
MQADALRSFEQMREVLTDGLGLNPSSELQELQRRVLQHDPALLRDGVVGRGAKSQGNLPYSAALFVGRTDELQRCVIHLSNRRVLTLTGPGGVGKSRLAIEVASLVVERFRGGAWLVELASVVEPDAVVSVMASSFSIQTQPDMSRLESIVEWLQGREMLLLLDNCEHVLRAAGELVEAIVARCPTVVVLATSREPLGVPGEQVHPLAPLSEAEAVALFVDRAGAADGTFVATQADNATLAEICQRLDCLPMAIELAAARIRSTSPDDLLARLIDHVPVSRDGGRGPSRHRTLRATVAWSYQLLTDAEQAVFDRTSVFAGAFDLDAATAVCADESIDRVVVVGVLDSLVDRSMLVAVRSARSVHFRVLEMLRQYGEERLAERTGTVATRDRHLAHYVSVAGRAQELWVSVRQVDGAAMFDAAWDNLRSAHGWAIETKDIAAADAIIALSGYHAEARVRHEHRDWAMRTISLETIERHPHPDTFGWAAIWTAGDGDEDAALTLLDRAIESATAPDHSDTAFCWGIKSTLLCLAFGRMDEAQHAATQAELAAANHPDRFARLGAINALAIVSIATDDGLAGEYVDRLTAAAKEIGAPILIARAATIEGHRFLAPTIGGLHEAIRCFQRSAEIARAMGDVRFEGEGLLGIAIASTALRSASAAEDCAAALANLYAARSWHSIWRLADPLAAWLASNGHTDVAAVIYGYLDAHQPRGLAGFMDMRSRGIERVRHVENANNLLAIGAEKNRDQLIDYVLARLEYNFKDL